MEERYVILEYLILAYCRLGIAGLSPRAPGTAGSALAACWRRAIFLPLPLWGRLLFLAVIVVTGGLAATRAEILLGRTDPGEVVIDELAGVWIALLPLGADQWSWPGLVWAFALFRLFDIWKPWPVHASETWLPAGWGIMLTISWPVSWPCAACWCCGPWAGSRDRGWDPCGVPGEEGRPFTGAERREASPYLPPSALYSERVPGRPDASRMGCGLAGTENKKDAETSFLFFLFRVMERRDFAELPCLVCRAVRLRPREGTGLLSPIRGTQQKRTSVSRPGVRCKGRGGCGLLHAVGDAAAGQVVGESSTFTRSPGRMRM